MNKRMFARAGAMLAAVAMSTGVLVAVSAPAQAASLGDVVLSQQSGSVTDTPMFASATSAACPAGYGENASLRVGRPNEVYSNLARSLGGGGFDLAPVSFAADRSFSTSLGGVAPGNGEWWVIVECYSLTLGRHVDEFRTSIVVNGSTWRVAVAYDTTTTLAISPASNTVTEGGEVTLSATVAAAEAGAPAVAGTVEFRRGTNVIGSAPVAGGTATLATTALPAGTFNYTAVFTPANSADFKSSASAAVSYQIIRRQSDVPPADVEIIADVAPGAFTLAVAAPNTSLAGGTVGGTATGALPTATVTDLRGNNTAWNLTGSLEDFSQGTNTIANSALTWTPSAAKTSGSGAVAAGGSASLGDTRTLCSAVAGTNAGVFTCGANLSLAIPDNVPPGEYTATLTLTLA